MFGISIHAPSRERPFRGGCLINHNLFQSTLPRGSDQSCYHGGYRSGHFNPRSLAGATLWHLVGDTMQRISIHAPSRERPCSFLQVTTRGRISIHAPSRERHYVEETSNDYYTISIHAPSRERLFQLHLVTNITKFQSTLPRGSDGTIRSKLSSSSDFNPRSLAGATTLDAPVLLDTLISIHAPSRERQGIITPSM